MEKIYKNKSIYIDSEIVHRSKFPITIKPFRLFFILFIILNIIN